MKKLSIVLIALIVQIYATDTFVTTDGTVFYRNGKPYYYMGTNFWYGFNLAHSDPDHLERELASLKAMGITNLRIMANSQGASDVPFTMHPSMEPDNTGNLNEDLLKGLDKFLAKMKEYGMTAVVPLNNFWFWSGGFAEYVKMFCNGGDVPYPLEPYCTSGNCWDIFADYAKKFYTCDRAQEQYKAFFDNLAERTNTVTNVKYKDDPTIMAWQLANEPWPVDLGETYTTWVKNSVEHIKSIDKNHLVSVGIEGLNSDKDYERNSQYPDYLTCHVWVQNWGWYDPHDDTTFESAKKKAEDYIDEHLEIIKRLNKPFVVEEFGMSRKSNSLDPMSTTPHKDEYYGLIFEHVYNMALSKLASGVNFWAWGGEGRPAHTIWETGDPWTGDPPHEDQGWYSVYDKDVTTITVITKYAEKFNARSEERRVGKGCLRLCRSRCAPYH